MYGEKQKMTREEIDLLFESCIQDLKILQRNYTNGYLWGDTINSEKVKRYRQIINERLMKIQNGRLEND